jgi:oligoribonuclease NrnB/cAMP/cGMP phosphodiesterase (DHH superfamily)
MGETVNNPIIIHHAPCFDGTVAAWVAWTSFEGHCELLPAKYGDAAPDVTGRHVLIVDFSYPRATLLEMADKATSIRVLDHHATAQADLAGLEVRNGLDFCTFDMNRSGAGLAWDLLCAGEKRPWLVDYVEDRDLWKFALPASKEVNAFIGLYAEATWEEWDALAEKPLREVIEAGCAVQRKVEAYVDGMAKQARMLRVAGHDVPVVNAPYINTSELVGHLAERADFAVGWFQRYDGMFQYSLRSRGDYDVSKLALTYGGGGHVQAAGFVSELPPDQLFAKEST